MNGRRIDSVAVLLFALLVILVPACGPGASSDREDAAAGGSAVATGASAAADPLPSWNAGQVKESIFTFVQQVTDEGNPDFVPAPERVAVFDNDGTLWSEQPLYFQLLFALDRVKALAAQHPEWERQQPFQAVLEGDLNALMARGTHALVEIVLATHSGMTTQEFEEVVSEWIASARHPVSERAYTEMIYQPMLELLSYLRENGFRTYIVSGGGLEFMRPWVQEVYGIPPEQVVGSGVKVEFQMDGDEPVLVHLPEIDFINDGAGKPVGIHRFIGRRPIFAFGNSDGDLQMLQWTAAGDGPSFMGLVHHTDAGREWAYDRDSSIGRLDEALDQANERGWTVVDMQQDWATIYPSER